MGTGKSVVGYSFVELHPHWRYGLVCEARMLRLNTAQQVRETTYLAGVKAGIFRRARAHGAVCEGTCGRRSYHVAFQLRTRNVSGLCRRGRGRLLIERSVDVAHCRRRGPALDGLSLRQTSAVWHQFRYHSAAEPYAAVSVCVTPFTPVTLAFCELRKSHPTAGNVTVTQVPFPGALSSRMLPLALSTIALQMESPRPVPPVSRERERSSR